MPRTDLSGTEAALQALESDKLRLEKQLNDEHLQEGLLMAQLQAGSQSTLQASAAAFQGRLGQNHPQELSLLATQPNMLNQWGAEQAHTGSAQQEDAEMRTALKAAQEEASEERIALEAAQKDAAEAWEVAKLWQQNATSVLQKFKQSQAAVATLATSAADAQEQANAALSRAQAQVAASHGAGVAASQGRAANYASTANYDGTANSRAAHEEMQWLRAQAQEAQTAGSNEWADAQAVAAHSLLH
jgi:hypothetical protein